MARASDSGDRSNEASNEDRGAGEGARDGSTAGEATVGKTTAGDPTSDDTDPCCVEPVHTLSGDALTEDVTRLAAAGNETRYEALRYVAAADGGRCVCELESALGVTQGAVSQALSRLSTAGLVTRRNESRWRFYEPTPAAHRLLETLDAIREGE
jgi:ArsR family transcriptional regulator